jgi:adenylate cyclase
MAKRNINVPPENRIEFRIGINVGDIIKDGDDIFGNGVNVAAQLESIADRVAYACPDKSWIRSNTSLN